MKNEMSPKTIVLAVAAVVVAVAALFLLMGRGPSGDTPEELGLGKPAVPGGGVEGEANPASGPSIK